MVGSLYIGVDSGGTRTRVVVVDENCHAVGWASGSGANRWSSGQADPWATVLGVIEQALVGTTGTVRRVTVGLSSTIPGASLDLSVIGLDAATTTLDDYVVAFASASDLDRGALLIAGTGSGAFIFENWQCVRRVDGHGWLFGDRGSAVWIGRAAVEAVLAHLDGSGPETGLTGRLLWRLEIEPCPDQLVTCETLTQRQLARPPATLGEFAQDVLALAPTDRVAGDIVERAADALVASITAAAHSTDHDLQHIVTCGSVAGSTAIKSALRSRLPAAEFTHIDDGLVGSALWAWNGGPMTGGTELRRRLRSQIIDLRDR